MPACKRFSIVVLLFVALSAGVIDAQFQLPGAVRGLLDRGRNKVLDSVVGELLDLDRQPITTSFAGARASGALPEALSPATFEPLAARPRTIDGAFVLTAGAFEGRVQSYCLRAGTYGPGRGDGYASAPIQGPKAQVVRTILQQAALNPQVSQHTIQQLLWGVVARSSLADMSPPLQRAAASLLPERLASQLSGGPLSRLPDPLRELAESQVRQRLAALTGPLRQIFDAESLLREQLESNAPFDALERAAVLVGVPPEDPLARRVPRGQWIAHPAGYFVRYLPDSYSSTLVQMVVPQSAVDAVGARGVLVFDVTEELAVPANTSSQRLALTARMADGESPPCTQIQQGMPATIARGGASPEALRGVSARCPIVDQPYYTDSGESEVPSRTPANGKPNSEQEFPTPNGKTIRVYGPDGRAIKDTDYGHDHGAGYPHIHDWDWSKERPRQPGRPPKEGEIR